MSPPFPPLPPSGPARGLNFSRRTETHPLPPLPARRCNVTRSTNVAMVLSSKYCCDAAETADGRAEARPSGSADRGGGSGPDGHDVDDLAAALVAELDRTCGEGEEGVVAATADVHAGVEVGAALADQDLARVDGLAAEALHAEALSVGVAAVASGARSLFVCHGVFSSSLWATLRSSAT